MTTPMPPPAPELPPVPVAPPVETAPKSRRRPSWVWVVVALLLVGVVVCGLFARGSAGSLHRAEQTEHQARHALAVSQLDERASARALARYRTRVAASALAAHRILELDHQLADLAANEGVHARQMIAASLSDNVSRFNALADEANVLKDQANALLDQLAPLQAQFAAPPAT